MGYLYYNSSMIQIEKNILRAIKQYNLIENGDVVAIGLSVGKDSLAMLVCIANIKKYYNKKFDIIAIVWMKTKLKRQQKIYLFLKILDQQTETHSEPK